MNIEQQQSEHAQDVIAIDNLAKSYGPTRAVDRSSWSVARGELLGFLGPNGAGKTTTLRILLGLLKADSGQATVFGLDSWRDSTEIRRRVGYLPGDVRLYDHLTGMQTARFAARVRGIPKLGAAERLAERFQFDLTKRVREYSKGMRQKLGLIVAMLHEPELLILDEPTDALDPLMQQAVHDELRQVTAAGRTVLFSSHSLPEVETLCESVVILRAGSVIASCKVGSLRRDALQKISLRFMESADTAALRATAPAGLMIESCDDSVLRGRWKGELATLLAWITRHPVDELVLQKPDLEDLFLAYYGAGNSNTARNRSHDTEGM